MFQHSKGKSSRAADKAVAMVMKEIPRQPSAEEKPLLSMTSQLVNEQQESRPLLSPSIDDFLCETKSEAKARPVTSNTAVLSPGLDLLDLSEPITPAQSKGKKSESALKGESSKGQSIKKKVDETDLIKSETERSTKTVKIPEKSSLDLVHIQMQLEKWGDGCFRGDKSSEGHGGLDRKSSSKESSKELLWSADGRSQGDPVRNRSNVAATEQASDLELAPAPKGLLTRESRLGGAFLSRNHSLEEEFERAKAAVESDTEFWDKMQAEWEEMARRNWISDNSNCSNQSGASSKETGYYFHMENPFRECSAAFEEGMKKFKEGDLPLTILYLEAAILQDPNDAEAWQYLGITQAENENEQAAIVSLQRCLQLQPNNLKALMALAVSYTNIGHQQDAYEALKMWIKQNPRYKYLVKKSESPALTRRMSKPFCESASLEEVKDLYLEAAHQNGDLIDPDLQTGLGVLFNLSGEFERAVDAFNSALMVRPDDYSLWNRLGATLANGDKSEEAVEAYSKALEIQPGFIRSRYNLGISCINLGAHREAVSNFLTALSLQRKSRTQLQSHHPVISGNIWAALRIALSMMDQPELFHAANVGDLDILLRAFNIES
ncbi:PREDICTED: PEX5-related protein isoform X2 [Nanorana parkeri]|uniref:PEX5-related protein isoform X2 n=1 Tax=Nanorana parkeri TaxID=125878 RepID=UPI000853F182|nr:PREDICTED: PEX5-related protein isoform X2 [Nanorana parkeri]